MGKCSGFPMVSVIIPTLNRHNLLLEAVKSVAAQSYERIEIVVVDDASETPVLRSQLQEIASERDLFIVRNAERLGGAASRNRGVAAASGEMIAFLDDDDIYFEGKIGLLVRALEDDNDIDAVFGKVKLFDGVHHVEKFQYLRPFCSDKNIALMNLVHNNATLIRRGVFGRLKFLESLDRYQDLQFNVELAKNFRIRFVDEFVAEWRVDERQDKVTSRGDRSKRERDLKSFERVYCYLKDDLQIESRLLGLYELRLLRLYAGELRVSKLVAFLMRRQCVLWHLYDALALLRLRRAHWPRVSQ